jgi:hypothetical protein
MKLPATSAAIIIHEDGQFEMHLPNHKGTDIMPVHEQLIAAIGVKLTKEEFRTEMLEFINSSVRQHSKAS